MAFRPWFGPAMVAVGRSSTGNGTSYARAVAAGAVPSGSGVESVSPLLPISLLSIVFFLAMYGVRKISLPLLSSLVCPLAHSGHFGSH